MRKATAVGLIASLFLIGGLAQIYGSEEAKLEEIPMASRVTITVVYDNYPSDPRLRTAWGFGCLIEGLEETILFDTGGNGAVLLGNMHALKIDPSRIDTIVLSHIHGDHVGGLSAVLAEHSDVRVVMSASFPRRFKDDVRALGAEVVEVHDPLEICANAYSTGELGLAIKEQALAIKTEEGLVVVTGCAHPGVVSMIAKAKEILDEKIHLVMGGFHMGGVSKSGIEKVIAQFREAGVQKVAPSHCSGDLTRQLFQEAYKEDFILAGAGTQIEIGN